MPFGIARTEERVAVAAVDAQAEGAGGMLLLVGPVGRPVLRPHEDAVLAALRNFDLRHGVLDRRTQTVCQEVARPHLLHELGIGRPAALVPEIGSREQYGVARRQLRDARSMFPARLDPFGMNAGGRSPDDQFGFDHHAATVVVAGDHAPQHLERLLAQPAGGLGDVGDRRFVEREDLAFVEAHQREVFGRREVQCVERLQAQQGQRIGRQQERLHAPPHGVLEDVHRILLRMAVDRIVDLRIALQSVAAHGLAIAPFALRKARNTQRVGDHLDTAVTVLVEVFHAHPPGPLVVQHHAPDIESRDVAVEQHGGNAGVERLAEHLLAARTGRDDQPFDAVADEGVDDVVELLGIFVRTAEQYRIIVVVRDVLDVAGDIGEELVGDVRRHHADRIEASAAQTRRSLVGAVPQPFGHLRDAAGRILVDVAVQIPFGVALGVHHQRHERNGDARLPGDVAYGYFSHDFGFAVLSLRKSMKRFNKIQIFDRKNKFPVPNRNEFSSFPLFLSLIHMQGIELSTSLIKRFISLIYNDLYTTYRFCFPPSGRFRGPEPLPVPRRSISFTSDQKMRNRSPAHAESQKIVNFERIFPETTLRKPPARFRNGHEDNRIVGIIRHRAAKKRGLRPDE